VTVTFDVNMIRNLIPGVVSHSFVVGQGFTAYLLLYFYLRQKVEGVEFF